MTVNGSFLAPAGFLFVMEINFVNLVKFIDLVTVLACFPAPENLV
jgi:hypothetical protein